MSKAIYTLEGLIKCLNLNIDKPNMHCQIFRCYKGYDWLHYIRHEKNLACSLQICGTDKRSLLLVGLAPNIVYPLRQIETIRILEGDIVDNMGKKRSDYNYDTFTIDKNQQFILNGKRETSILCMLNHII